MLWISGLVEGGLANQTVTDSTGMLSTKSSLYFVPLMARIAIELWAGRRLAVLIGGAGGATWARYTTTLTGLTSTSWGERAGGFVELHPRGGAGAPVSRSRLHVRLREWSRAFASRPEASASLSAIDWAFCDSPDRCSSGVCCVHDERGLGAAAADRRALERRGGLCRHADHHGKRFLRGRAHRFSSRDSERDRRVLRRPTRPGRSDHRAPQRRHADRRSHADRAGACLDAARPI